MLYDCYDEADSYVSRQNACHNFGHCCKQTSDVELVNFRCFMKSMAHKQAALEKGRKHLSVTVTSSLMCRNRRIRAHASACLKIILTGLTTGAINAWLSSRDVAQCMFLCGSVQQLLVVKTSAKHGTVSTC